MALESVMKEALEAAEKAGAALFGEEGAKLGRDRHKNSAYIEHNFCHP